MRLAANMVGFGVAMVVASAPARADAPTQPQPWTIGVTAEQKAAAQQHLDAGNALFLEHKYSDALEEYKRATEAWNHPAIRFNMVRCLIFLERPLEASDNLKLALAYGVAPFDESIYNEALAYEKLLASEIGELEIHCDQPGVQLTMDGHPLHACPTKEERRVLPGKHQIVGTKPGYVPHTFFVMVLGGKHEHAQMDLDPLSKVARIEHRWAPWIPWTVFGGGFALAGIGGLFHLKASSDNSTYAGIVSSQCPDGCGPGTNQPAPSGSLESSARFENGIAIGLIAAGAAAAVTGTVLLYLNRGHTTYDLGKETTESRGARIDVVPTHDGAAVSLSGRF